MRVSIFIILAALLISCNNSTGVEPDEFEPFKVGTWLVTSPETAEWQGRDGVKAKTDSIKVTSPGKYQLYIDSGEYTDSTWFDIIMVDSTFTTADRDSLGMGGGWNEVYFPNTPKDRPFSPGGVGVNTTSERMRVRLPMQRLCNVYNTDVPLIAFEMYNQEKDTLYRRYEFEVEGLGEAAYEVTSCD